MSNRRSTAGTSSQWLVPGACVVFGAAFLVIGMATDKTRFGVTGLVVMLAYGAALVVLRRRNEPAALLGGDLGDERRVLIAQQAAAFTGRLLIVAVVAAFFYSAATDNRYAGVFSALAAVGGLSLMASTIWYSRRG